MGDSSSPLRARRRRRGDPAPVVLPATWNECVRGQRISWENRRVRSELVCFGEVMYQPGGHSGPRQQRDFQLVFLHSGELSATVDGETAKIVPGQVGLFVPGRTETFAFSDTHASHHSWCTVAPSLVSAELEPLLVDSPVNVQAADDVQARLLAAGMALDNADSPVARSLVDQIGVALFSAFAKAAAEQASLGIVGLAVRYMQQHLTDAECLQQAHAAAGVSRNTLISRFREQLGTTPARHLWRLRAERGIAMLADSSLTLAEIADACGFGDPFHFSRLVKSLQGVSPNELRRRLTGKND